MWGLKNNAVKAFRFNTGYSFTILYATTFQTPKIQVFVYVENHELLQCVNYFVHLINDTAVLQIKFQTVTL